MRQVKVKKLKMEEKRENEIRIRVSKRGGRVFNLNLDGTEEREGEFEKVVINEPEDLSFSKSTGRVIFEGFTEGAIKNLLTLTKKRIRL